MVGREGSSSRFQNRFSDVIASVYLHNEHAGWQGLERLLQAIREKMPGEREFISVVARHV